MADKQIVGLTKEQQDYFNEVTSKRDFKNQAIFFFECFLA